jgi:predicted transcriptional regulator
VTEHEQFIERIAENIERAKNSKSVHDTLEELLKNARRGIEIKKRFSPKPRKVLRGGRG